MRRLVLGMLVLQFIALAEDKKEESPKIDPAHLAEYYRADGTVAKTQAVIAQAQNTFKDAQLALKDQQVELQAAISAIQKDCGDKYMPYQDPAKPKEIVCVVKPAQPEKK